jgi:hypothetical protein
MRGCMRRGRTEELLCGNKQMGDGLFYLRKLLLGLHWSGVSDGFSVLGAGCGEQRAHVHSWAHGAMTPETSGQTTTPLSCLPRACGAGMRRQQSEGPDWEREGTTLYPGQCWRPR